MAKWIFAYEKKLVKSMQQLSSTALKLILVQGKKSI